MLLVFLDEIGCIHYKLFATGAQIVPNDINNAHPINFDIMFRVSHQLSVKFRGQFKMILFIRRRGYRAKECLPSNHFGLVVLSITDTCMELEYMSTVNNFKVANS